MPIEFDDSRVDVGGVDDRRGGGGRSSGAAGSPSAGGAGVVGLIIYLIFSVLGGGGGTGGTGGLAAADRHRPGGLERAVGETREQLQQRCNSSGALDKYTDCRLIKVYNVADTVWSEEFRAGAAAVPAHPSRLLHRRDPTGCGKASASTGPFYCPADQELYFDLGFLQQLQDQFGAQGQFAQAYIVAHEFGHHLQTLLGTEPKVRAAQERNPSLANRYSVALELQADCYAGVWANARRRSPGRTGSTSPRTTSPKRRRRPPRSATTGSSRRRRAGSTPRASRTAPREQRSDWFTTGYRVGRHRQLRHLQPALIAP